MSGDQNPSSPAGYLDIMFDSSFLLRPRESKPWKKTQPPGRSAVSLVNTRLYISSFLFGAFYKPPLYWERVAVYVGSVFRGTSQGLGFSRNSGLLHGTS